MTMKARATLAALLLSLGLLTVVGASSFRSTAIIKHDRAVQRGEAAGGGVLLGFTFRDMNRQIGDIQSRAEAQLRMEAAVKRDPKPKP